MTRAELERVAARLAAAGLKREAAALRAVLTRYRGVKLDSVIALASIVADEANLTRRVSRVDELKTLFNQATADLRQPPSAVRELLTEALRGGATASAEMLALQAAAPDLIAFRLRPDREIEYLQHVGARLTRYWGAEQADLATRVEKTFVEALERGQGRRQITAALRRELDFSKNRASLIARNELGNAAAYGMEQTQRQAGCTAYIWSSAGDNRVRPAHRARNGQRFAWNAPPADGHPGQAIQCRCAALAVLPDNWRSLAGLP